VRLKYIRELEAVTKQQQENIKSLNETIEALRSAIEADDQEKKELKSQNEAIQAMAEFDRREKDAARAQRDERILAHIHAAVVSENKDLLRNVECQQNFLKELIAENDATRTENKRLQQIIDKREKTMTSLKNEATDAAWRTAGSQFVKLAREPLVAALSANLAPGDVCGAVGGRFWGEQRPGGEARSRASRAGAGGRGRRPRGRGDGSASGRSLDGAAGPARRA
jgi:hypothetical protein